MGILSTIVGTAASAADPVSAVANVVNTIVSRFPDPAAQAAAKEQMAQMYMNGELQQMTAQAGVITAEANSANKLASSWRPCLMYLFMLLIFNNYFFAPYMSALFGWHVVLDLPNDMWGLIKLAMGGYVMGRSLEKVTTPHPITGQAPLATAASAVSDIFKGH